MFRSSLPSSTSVSFSPHSAPDEDRAHSPTSPAPLIPLSEDAPIRTIPHSAIRIPMSDTNDITLHSGPIPTKTKRTEDEKEQRRAALAFQNLVQEQEEAENHINTDGPWGCLDDDQSWLKTLSLRPKGRKRNNHLTINTTLAQSYKPYQALPLIDTHSENNAQSEELAGSSPVGGSEDGENGSPATSLLVVAKYRDEDGVVEDRKLVLEKKGGRSGSRGSLEGSPQCSLHSNTPSVAPIASSVRFIDGDGDVVVDMVQEYGESAFVVMEAEIDTAADMEDEDEDVEESVADANANANANEEYDSDDEMNEVGTDFETDRILRRGSRRGSRAVRKCESAQVPSSVRDFADGLFCQSASERDSEDDDERSIPSSPSPSLMAREIDELDLDLEMDFVVVDSDADVDEDDLEDRYDGLRGVGEMKVLTGCVGRTKAGIDGGSLRLDGMVWESVVSAGGEGKEDVCCVRRC